MNALLNKLIIFLTLIVIVLCAGIFGTASKTGTGNKVHSAVAAKTPIRKASALTLKDEEMIIAPYSTYIVTQDPHGMSYGHYAIDLTAGKGATIRSPINGIVTQLFTDYLGNPTLIIENNVYQIILMHGDYNVEVGQILKIGEPVGTESNNGNTVDWNGVSCRGRDCGYHSHFNVFDKRINQNVNPLDVIPASK